MQVKLESLFGPVNLKGIIWIAASGFLLGFGIILNPDLALYLVCVSILALIAFFIIEKSPFNLILLFIAILPFQNFIFMQLAATRFVPETLLRLIFSWKDFFLLILLVYILFSGRMRSARFYAVDYLMLAYFSWTALYLILPASFFPLAGDPSAKLLSFRTAIVPVGLYFIGRFIPFSRKDLESAVNLVIICAFIVCVFGIFEKIFIPDSFWINSKISYFLSLKGHQLTEGLPANFYGIYGSSIRRLVSTYVDSLAFGFANILVIPLVLYFLYSRNLKIFKNMGFGLALIFIIGLAQALNITRAAIMANFIEIGLLLYYLKNRRWPLIIFSILIAVFIFFSPLFWRVYNYSANLSDSSSVAHLRSLDTGIRNILVHPGGYGLGYGGYVGRAMKTELASESLYFTIAVERGIAGMVLFSLAALAIFFFCLRNLKYLAGDPLLKGLAYVIIISTVGYAFASFTTEHWQAFVSSGVYWIFSGLVIQAISGLKDKNEVRI